MSNYPQDILNAAQKAVASWQDGSPPVVADLVEVVAEAIQKDRASQAALCFLTLPDGLQEKADRIVGVERDFWRGAAHAQTCIHNALLGLPPPTHDD